MKAMHMLVGVSIITMVGLGGVVLTKTIKSCKDEIEE